MRYRIIEIKNKPEKITIKCLDIQEKALLKISLNPDTFEFMDPFIPDCLQRFIEANHVAIHKIFLSQNQVHNNTQKLA